ncbi:MAG: nucleotidyl transferase AbiEii/AbiGii toxin family protein [Saprospiraceae bacterium]|nr:nucleotidyl transferase AbiEii/AbiGii toxin family protein [Saprospiraceae bacterium]
MAKPYLDAFFLVGGTALALQMGHRFSIDLDLFTLEDFDQDELRHALSRDFPVLVESSSPSIFITRIDDVKVDFVRFRYGLLFPMLHVDGVRMLDARDIGPMKLDAIAKRGSKKDFFDLYYLIQKWPLTQLLDWYDQKFHHSTLFHIIKSLTYFDDAEGQADPVVFDNHISWEQIKIKLSAEVRKLYH